MRKQTRLCQKEKIYKGLQSPKYQEKLRNARLCNNDKSALYLPRQCLRDVAKSLDFIGFLGWKRRIYTFGRSDRNNRENKEIDKYNMDRFCYIGNI